MTDDANRVVRLKPILRQKDIERLAQNIIQGFDETMADCLEAGMRAPLIACVLTHTGVVVVARLAPGECPEILVENVPELGVGEPTPTFTLTVLDQTNRVFWTDGSGPGYLDVSAIWRQQQQHA